MRILMMHHFPLAQSEAGRLAWRWARALDAAGHNVQLLIVDKHRRESEPLAVERVICRDGDIAADLPFAPPQFSTADGSKPQLTFGALSDSQLAGYREQVRRRLDSIIDRFDPHLIHAQHIWIQGQLGLETGVPYVLNAWNAELIDYESQPRYRALADQAAENAGRILVPDDGLLRRVVAMFDVARERMLVMPAELMPSEPADSSATSNRLLEIYQAVLDERFGKRP